ncbi:MAG: DUF1361 domain-containing protein [Chloroflexi bacterium]|nr:DUF1361 domain-containing protein [Chloroflexota bacterium]
MTNTLKTIRNTHEFFTDHLLYPLALSTALAISIYAGRVLISRQLTFFFLLWNIFLAWIPYLCALWMASLHRRAPRQGWLLILPGIAWLIFLPNAPYIVTDLLHLDERPGVPLWYDIGLLATFAWTGCFLALASLRMLQRIARDYWGRAFSWLFVCAAIGLSGIGIYLGRFLSWNTWDLILHPRHVIADVLTRFAHPFQYPQAFGVSFLFAAFLLVCYLMFASLDRREVERG